MDQHNFKKVSKCQNTSLLETSGSQNPNPLLTAVPYTNTTWNGASMTPCAKQFGENRRIVLSKNQQIYIVDSA